ncbi:hypothetical protein Taro_033231, partial [Colocasia esculenta]|nr:hypothetical protein [Colocasia esculenta]
MLRVAFVQALHRAWMGRTSSPGSEEKRVGRENQMMLPQEQQGDEDVEEEDSEMDQFAGPVDTSVLYAQSSHRSQLVHAGQETDVLKCWEHHRSLGAWTVDPRIVEYVHRSGLFHLTQVQWIRLDWALITALVERWRSETQTFHLRHGEMSITLHDVAILMGLPIDGDAVVGDTTLDWTDACMALLGDVPDTMKRDSVKISWLRERFTSQINCRWNVRRAEINNPRHVLRLYISEFDHQEDYRIRWEPYTADILEMLPAVFRQTSYLWLSRVPLLSFSIVEMHVPDRVLRQFGRVHHIPGPVDALDRVTRKGREHIDWARYFAHFVQMWHHRADYIIPPDEETVGIGRGEYMAWYWSITRRYIARSGFNYNMRYEPRDHIERSLVDGTKHLHMMASVGLQDDISDRTQSTFISMQMYIDSVLSHVQRTDSSTSHAGPSEPCAGTPQQPDDAGPSHFSPD